MNTKENARAYAGWFITLLFSFNVFFPGIKDFIHEHEHLTCSATYGFHYHQAEKDCDTCDKISNKPSLNDYQGQGLTKSEIASEIFAESSCFYLFAEPILYSSRAPPLTLA